MSEAGAAVAAARAGAVAVADSFEVVWLTGPDTVVFLDGLLSQNIAAMAVGSTARSLLLAPQGKLRATLVVLRGDDRVGLICDAGYGAVVAGDLHRFRIRVDVTIEIAQGPLWEVWGDPAVAGLSFVPEPGCWAETDGVLIAPRPFRHAGPGRFVVVGATPDCPVVAVDDLLPLRIELGEPVMGIDLTESTIPQEGADVAASVDFSKGCYLGQELVARIDSRGHVNKRLGGVLIAGSVVPSTGCELIVAGRSVGVLTSAAWSSERSCVVALAMVRTEVMPGSEVEVDGAVGTIVDLPMTW